MNTIITEENTTIRKKKKKLKKEGVSKAQKRPQYKSKLATLVKYT